MCSSVDRAELLLVVVDRQAASLARQFLSSRVCATHCSQLMDQALLLVSEAVTNAVRHGRPPVLIAVDCEGLCGLQVRVRDGSPTEPRLLDPGPFEEGGRGMQLIDLVSSRWGVDHDSQGKAVWFVLTSADD